MWLFRASLMITGRINLVSSVVHICIYSPIPVVNWIKLDRKCLLNKQLLLCSDLIANLLPAVVDPGGGFRGLELPFLDDQCIWKGTYSWNPLFRPGLGPLFKMAGSAPDQPWLLWRLKFCFSDLSEWRDICILE